MKSINILVSAALLLGLLPMSNNAMAQPTAFTYQGQLLTNGLGVNGAFDLSFSLYSTNSGGSPVAGPVTNTGVIVSNGLFTTTMDFGSAVFNGTPAWLGISIRPSSVANFTGLGPRQALTPVPNAIYAATAALAGAVPAAGVSGTLAASALPGTVVTNGETGLSISGTFSGNGAGLTGLDATNLTDGISMAPSQFFILGDIPALNAFDVAVKGNYAYMASSLWGLLVADLSNPNMPAAVAAITNTVFGGGPNSLTISGTRLYLGSGLGGLGCY